MSTPAIADFSILDLICNLIKSNLDLTDEEVWIYNQKRKIPNSPGLFVEVARISARPFSSNSKCDDDEAGNFVEVQTVNMQETYGITLFSRDESALSRSHEIVMALTGVLSQQIQEQYSFKFGNIPTSFNDTSFLEASARLFRQDVVFNAIRFYSKTRVIQYFDQFNIPPEIHVNP